MNLGRYVFTDEAAKITQNYMGLHKMTRITGKKGLSLGLFFLLHTRLGRGARDWGEMLTTLVILRTAYA